MNEAILMSCIDEAKRSTPNHSTMCTPDPSDPSLQVQVFSVGSVRWVIARFEREMDVHPLQVAATFQAGVLAGVAMAGAHTLQAVTNSLHNLGVMGVNDE